MTAEPAAEERWIWVPFEVDKKFDGQRVDQFLCRRLAGYSRSQVQKMLASARVVKDGRPVKAHARVRSGQKVEIAYRRRPESPPSPEIRIPSLFEDEHYLVIDKPANVLSHPTDKIVLNTVLSILRTQRPDLPRLHLLHRLDRETSGVLALAKHPGAARDWARAMEKRRIQKEYIALVRGTLTPWEGVMDWPIGRQGGAIRVRQWINVPGAVPAVTRYKVEKIFAPHGTLVRAFPHTGRLHQIRVHFAALGHPLWGDPLYTGEGEIYRKMVDRKMTPGDRESLGFPRVALHASALAFDHPVTRESLRVESPLPPDMREAVAAAAA